GVGDDLEAAAALAVLAGPLGQAQLADHGDLAALGEPLPAGGGQLVEADDVDEVGAVAGGAGHGDAEGGGLVLLAAVGLGVGGEAANQSDTVHGVLLGK